MAANTWGEWWEAMYEVIKHQYSKEDISAIEELLRLNWNAATKAAEARFTSNNRPSAPCHRCLGVSPAANYQYCSNCGRKL